jgi:hypothetical protein
MAGGAVACSRRIPPSTTAHSQPRTFVAIQRPKKRAPSPSASPGPRHRPKVRLHRRLWVGRAESGHGHVSWQPSPDRLWAWASLQDIPGREREVSVGPPSLATESLVPPSYSPRPGLISGPTLGGVCLQQWEDRTDVAGWRCLPTVGRGVVEGQVEPWHGLVRSFPQGEPDSFVNGPCRRKALAAEPTHTGSSG